ncbi:hypothetical protein ALQ20_200212 [Pseudomonas syringae pv. atrofaciens]|nr:hypothetical protein ALQ20_200212 [Pseudomonas syringae pv. atrofaciens]
MVNDAVRAQHALPGRVRLTWLVGHGISKVGDAVDLLLQLGFDIRQRTVNVSDLLVQRCSDYRQASIDRIWTVTVDLLEL